MKYINDKEQHVVTGTDSRPAISTVALVEIKDVEKKAAL